MKILSEMKDLIINLKGENLEDVKLKLLRNINLIALSLEDEEELTNEQLESIYALTSMKDSLRENKELELYDIGAILIIKIKNAFDEFTTDIIEKGFLNDVLELTSFLLSIVGGGARRIKLLQLNKNKESDYFDTKEYFFELKKELYKQIDLKSSEGAHVKVFLVNGIIESIKSELATNSQKHGSLVISLLNDYKISSEEVNERSYFKRGYGRELQRRIYMWDKLTFDLKYDYSIDRMLDVEEHQNL